MARAIAFITDGGLLDRSRLSAEVVAGPRSDPGSPLADHISRGIAVAEKRLARSAAPV